MTRTRAIPPNPILGRRPRAFTIVELLVVIAVIATIVAITLPALSGARESAKRIQCLNNLRQLGVGVTMYMDSESDGVLPEVFPILQPGGLEANDISLLDILERYIDAPKPAREIPGDTSIPFIVQDPYRCPSDLYSDDDANQGWAVHETYGTSYAYPPGVVYFWMETALNMDPPYAPATTTGWRVMTERGREMPLLFDFDEWHPRSGGAGKNGVYISDGHADLLGKGQPDEGMPELIEASVRARGGT